MIYLGVFLFSNVCIYCYKIPPRHCLKGVLKFLICYIFIFSSYNVFFSFILRVPLWPLGYLKVCCLVSMCLETLSLHYRFLLWFHWNWKTYPIWFKLIQICWGLFFDPGYGLSWHMFCAHLKRRYILPFLGTVSCKCWLDPHCC